MPLIAVAITLIIMSLSPSLAFIAGCVLIGIHIGRRQASPRGTYTKRQDAGTLEQTIRYIEENRHD